MDALFDMEFYVPLVSENSMYAMSKVSKGKRHKFLTPKAKECIEDMLALIGMWYDKPVDYKVQLDIKFVFADRRKRDGQNYLKLPIDVLVKAGIIEDDHIGILKYITIDSSVDVELSVHYIRMTLRRI